MSNYNNTTYNININTSHNTINNNTVSYFAPNEPNENTVPRNDPRNEISIWIDETLPKLIESYDPNNIYNADETGMYLDPLTRIRDIVTKDNKCLNGQYAKERVTVLLCVNMNGTNKLPPLIIGHHDLSDNDNNNINSNNNNINYIKGNKAWMTKDIFGNWLEELNKNMINKGKKIILFVDRAASHLDLPTFDNVKISFIPAKTTAAFQPLDLGIIKEFKKEYKKLVPNDQLNATLALENLLKAWKAVTKYTIQKGFVNFKKPMTNEEKPRSNSSNADKDEKLFNKIKKKLQNGIKMQEYLDFDDNLAVCETNIFGLIEGVKDIRSFYEIYDKENEKIFKLFDYIEADLVTKTEEKQMCLKRKKQSSIPYFFNCKKTMLIDQASN